MTVDEVKLCPSPKFQCQVGGLLPPGGTDELKVWTLSIQGFPFIVNKATGLLLTFTVRRKVSLTHPLLPVTTSETGKLPGLV